MVSRKFKTFKMIVKILTIVWLLIIVVCILEAYFCSKFEDEL